jgi:hypothetical protein
MEAKEDRDFKGEKSEGKESFASAPVKYSSNSVAEDKNSNEIAHSSSGAKGLDPAEVMDVTWIKIRPNTICEASAPLHIEMGFTSSQRVRGHWTARLLVDAARAREVLQLGQTETKWAGPGDDRMEFSVPRIDLSGFSQNTAANCGLLTLAFIADGEEFTAVNFLVNISSGPADSLQREIINPLGEDSDED